MEDEKITLLIKIKKGDATVLTLKQIKVETFTFSELLVDVNELVVIRFPNFFIKRSVFYDNEFKAEVDILDNEIFLLQNMHLISFYIEETTEISVVRDLNKSLSNCSIASELDMNVVNKVKNLVDIAQPTCHSPDFTLWRKRVINTVGTHLVNIR
jgi:hypothetical protein